MKATDIAVGQVYRMKVSRDVVKVYITARHEGVYSVALRRTGPTRFEGISLTSGRKIQHFTAARIRGPVAGEQPGVTVYSPEERAVLERCRSGASFPRSGPAAGRPIHVNGR